MNRQKKNGYLHRLDPNRCRMTMQQLLLPSFLAFWNENFNNIRNSNYVDVLQIFWCKTLENHKIKSVFVHKTNTTLLSFVWMLLFAYQCKKTKIPYCLALNRNSCGVHYRFNRICTILFCQLNKCHRIWRCDIFKRCSFQFAAAMFSMRTILNTNESHFRFHLINLENASYYNFELVFLLVSKSLGHSPELTVFKIFKNHLKIE